MKNNILYIMGGEKASGAEIVIERLIAYNDFQSHLFIAPGDFTNSLFESKKPYKITVIKRLKKLNRTTASAFIFYINAIHNYIAISCQVYKYIKQHKINIVHCNTIGPASYLLPLVLFRRLFFLKVKWIWSDHDLKYYYFLDDFLSVLCSKVYDITFVVSEAVKLKYAANNKVIVLYNGLSCDVFKPDISMRNAYKAKLKLSDNDVLIGNAGILSLRKGTLDLIRAFNVLKKKYSNVHLALAGRFAEDEFIYNEEIKLIINSPGIMYLGQINDMVSFYNGCDIVISNSDSKGSEPLGTTIYEAMACEKIVLGSDTGGTKEIIDDKINGYLFEAENVDSLVSILCTVIENLSSYENIRSAAREKVKQKFDINIMVAKYRGYMLNNGLH